MSSIAPSPFVSQLPWSSSEQENKRFTRITLVILGITLALALVVKWQQLPQQTREEKQRLPPQLTKLIEARKVEPPKPVEQPKPLPEVKPPEPEKVEVKPPPEPPKPVKQPVAKPKPAPVKQEKPEPTQAELAEQARAKAKQSGLLAFSDDLASMRDSMQIEHRAQTDEIKGAGQSSQTKRSFVGKQVDSQSGGISTDQLSSDIGARGELAGRKTTEYTAPNEGLASLAAKEQVTAESVIGSRDTESIRQVLDANKGAIYAIYRRALRQDPSLQGKVTVNLQIQPDGSVSALKLISSELDNPELEAKLLARIRLINFGQQDVSLTELDYAFNFLPF